MKGSGDVINRSERDRAEHIIDRNSVDTTPRTTPAGGNGIGALPAENSVGDAILSDLDSEMAIPQENMSEKTAPKATAPDGAVSEETVPSGAVPDEPVPSGAVPEETVPSDATFDGDSSDVRLLDNSVDAELDDVTPPPIISIDLPAEVHSMPDDEVAVAIVDVPIDPSTIHVAQPTTMSIAVTVVPQLVTEDSDDDAAETTYSRRDRLRGAAANTPEPAAMLTAERLLGAGRGQRGRPEGRWPEFVYATTFGTVNLGDSRAARERKIVDARIRLSFIGGTRFVPVLTRKGGVGKTTVTTLLGMAMADAREDRIVAIDANPDRGTLAERVSKQTRATVRDVVSRASAVSSFADFTNLVSRDETRLDILASDTDPLLSEAFNEDDYNVVADLCARFYSIALTDCGTGIVHSVMRATLQRADSVVIVSGGSVDEARLASETLTWLEANGYSELVKNAVVALNTATQGTTLVKLEEVEAHFRSRVREIVRIPYDPQLAAGSVVTWKDLKPLTRSAARELAALVVEGLPSTRSA